VSDFCLLLYCCAVLEVSRFSYVLLCGITIAVLQGARALCFFSVSACVCMPAGEWAFLISVSVLSLGSTACNSLL
jgi:hypothetical protein